MTATARDRVAAGIVSTAVVAAVAAAIYLLRSPSEERTLRLDKRRVADLMALSGAVDVYWTRHQRLPASLDELQSEPVGRLEPEQPGLEQHARDLGGWPMGLTRCARPSARDSSARERPGARGDGERAHRLGRQCFPREPRALER